MKPVLCRKLESTRRHGVKSREFSPKIELPCNSSSTGAGRWHLPAIDGARCGSFTNRWCRPIRSRSASAMPVQSGRFRSRPQFRIRHGRRARRPGNRISQDAPGNPLRRFAAYERCRDTGARHRRRQTAVRRYCQARSPSRNAVTRWCGASTCISIAHEAWHWIRNCGSSCFSS